ncbi:MAG: MATE family efflux transporter [Oscillospiraceae bacterium]|nr:MATE family efflux transporter [Oscillospiraceae bacterium]
MFKRFIGDKAFYRRALAIAIPIMIQNGITNFVSLLDNIMVGQVGTIPMSGVSIANKLVFVFNLCIFGATSGAGIFTAQFHGALDHEGIRYTTRFKLLSCVTLCILSIGIFLGGGESLISLYLQGDGDPREAALTLGHGMSYLRIMLLGLLPFALSNAYSSTLRETGQTIVPMVAGIIAVFVNLIFNYILIFGHFGAPAMGVAGAAVATVISRYVELAIVVIWSHLHTKEHPYIQELYRSMFIPRDLLCDIVRKGLPLLANEFLWSTGVAFISQRYSTCGLDVVPAMNISTTLRDLASVAFVAMGSAVGIIMGQLLGCGARVEEVRDTNRKLIVLSVVSATLFGGVMALFSGLFPQLYNTTESVQQLSTTLILLCAALMPVNAFAHSAYFTLRSGGQAFITFLFDSCFVWGCCVPVSFILSSYTSLSIIPLFAICEGLNIIKSILGAYMIKQGKWIKNLSRT